MRYLLALLLALPLSGQSLKWEAAADALIIVDWGQTLRIVRDQEAGRVRHETNPFLGERPSRAAVNRYFAAVLITKALVWKFAPPAWTDRTNKYVFAIQAYAVSGNVRIGLRCTF